MEQIADTLFGLIIFSCLALGAGGIGFLLAAPPRWKSRERVIRELRELWAKAIGK